MTRPLHRVFTRVGLAAAGLILVPSIAAAAEDSHLLDFTSHWAAFLALGIFFAAYLLVIGEEALDMRKSKPVMVAAGIIWLIVAILSRTRFPWTQNWLNRSVQGGPEHDRQF